MGWQGLFILVLCFGAGSGLQACHSGPDDHSAPKGLRILSYNTQNLFDDVRAGNEYPEFLPALPGAGAGETAGSAKGWNRAAYRERLERLARVVKEAAGLPDIVLLYEVESFKVLEDLRQDFLPIGSYPHISLQADPGSSIHIGLLSRWPLAAMLSHCYAIGADTARPVWELHFDLSGLIGTSRSGPLAKEAPSGLVLFANHWKSKSGGELATEALRVLAAHSLAQAAEQSGNLAAAGLVIACGDFNEVPGMSQARSTAGSVRIAAPPGRTQGGRPFRLLSGWDGSLAITRQAGGRVVLADTGQIWQSPWLAAVAAGANEDGEPPSQPDAGYAFHQDNLGQGGSYWYDGQWEPIDHFFIKAGPDDRPPWEIRDFRVLAPAFIVDSAGLPRRYDSRTGKGFSDHLPILLELTSLNGQSKEPLKVKP